MIHRRKHSFFYVSLVAGIVILFLLLFFGGWAGLISVSAGLIYVFLRYRTRHGMPREPSVQQNSLPRLFPQKTGQSGMVTVSEEAIINVDKTTSMAQYISDDEHSSSSTAGFRIPAPPEHPVMAMWYARNQAVNIAGLSISGGMLYVGECLPGNFRSPDPGLIDPRKIVDLRADYNEDHSPNDLHNYSEVSPRARGAYLRWLADGRSGPEAHISNIWLFFFGLERRALIDCYRDKTLAAELPQIAKELNRLLKHYGEKSSSFQSKCSDLLQIVTLMQSPSKLYLEAVPEFAGRQQLPLYFRFAIGQAIVDKMPIPVDLAWAWIVVDAEIVLRTAATRCSEEFRALFMLKYPQLHGDGMKISPNKTRLKLTYLSASYGLYEANGMTIQFGDLPDVAAVSGPVKILQAVVDACASELDAYSRFVGRYPEKRMALDALVQLPVSIWPGKALHILHTIKAELAGGMMTLPLASLAGRFDVVAPVSKDIARGMAQALATVQVAMEPDYMSGADNGRLGQAVTLFEVPSTVQADGLQADDAIALLALELLIMQAQTNRVFSEEKLLVLDEQITSWKHLGMHQKCRLMARARLLLQEPMPTFLLKRKVEAAGHSAREACAAFIVRIAQTPDHAPRAEVAVLERLYAFLGIDAKNLYSALHSNSTASAAIDIPALGPVAFGALALDIARIAQLQRDSEKVAALLGNIFVDDMPPSLPVFPVAEFEDIFPPSSDSVLGLDSVHTIFVRQLVARPAWPRSELEMLARTLNIMLDGALEHVNEACLDAYDFHCTEGDDPVEINPEIHERIVA